MSSIKRRPNDVWLRIWLILTWIVLSVIDSVYITPKFTGIWYYLEMIAFTIILTTILTFMWILLKHPDCKCWDDIKVKQSGEVEES